MENYLKGGDDRLKKLSDAIIPVAVSELPGAEKSAVKVYLEGLQELLRLQIAVNRKQLAVSSALTTAKDATNDLKNSDYYGYNYARKRASDSLAEAYASGRDHG